MKKLFTMFLAGLATLLPIVISVWLVYWLFTRIDGILSPILEPSLGKAVPGLGFLLIIAFIILIGFISTNFLGSRILSWWHKVLSRIPLLGKIYATVKRITDSFFASGKSAFKYVALVEFPRQGIYSLGFITNDSFPYTEQDCYSVFIPTTPNPTSGWFIILPREQVKILDISVDRGMELIISAGMVNGIDKDIPEKNLQ